MMDAQLPGELLEEPRPIRTALDHQLFERPGFAGPQLEAFSINDRG